MTSSAYDDLSTNLRILLIGVAPNFCDHTFCKNKERIDKGVFLDCMELRDSVLVPTSTQAFNNKSFHVHYTFLTMEGNNLEGYDVANYDINEIEKILDFESDYELFDIIYIDSFVINHLNVDLLSVLIDMVLNDYGKLILTKSAAQRLIHRFNGVRCKATSLSTLRHRKSTYPDLIINIEQYYTFDPVELVIIPSELFPESMELDTNLIKYENIYIE